MVLQHGGKTVSAAGSQEDTIRLRIREVRIRELRILKDPGFEDPGFRELRIRELRIRGLSQLFLVNVAEEGEECCIVSVRGGT